MRGIQGSFHFAFVKKSTSFDFCRLEARLSQPVSLWRDCSDVARVTIWAASFWIFPGLSIHIECSYSRLHWNIQEGVL